MYTLSTIEINPDGMPQEEIVISENQKKQSKFRAFVVLETSLEEMLLQANCARRFCN